MRKRLIMGVLLTVAMVGLSGCPPREVSTRTWVFTIVGFDNPFGIDLLEDGSTQDPFPIPDGTDLLEGTVTWMQNGSDFTMSQVADTYSVGYTGTIISSTSIEGTWGSSDFGSGTWTAERF